MTDITPFDGDTITQVLLDDWERGIDWNFQRFMAEKIGHPSKHTLIVKVHKSTECSVFNKLFWARLAGEATMIVKLTISRIFL